MNKKFLFALSLMLASSPAFAYLPASAITSLSLPVYGIYMTADPTCTSGLVATVALSNTAQTINFASSAIIGSGSIPSTIGCVIIVIGNSLTAGWAAGSYTGTSTNGGNNTYNDSNCNAGGTTTGQAICNSGTVSWPSQITTDAAAVGLTLHTGTCTAVTTDVVPLVLSTDSLCTGQSTADALVTACAGGNINNFALPTSSSDATHGTKLTAPATTGDFKFIVDPANTFGGASASTCGNIAAPLFSFAAK